MVKPGTLQGLPALVQLAFVGACKRSQLEFPGLQPCS